MEPERTVRIYDARGNGEGGVSPTLTGDHENRITDYTALVLMTIEGTNSNARISGGSVSPTIIARAGTGGVMSR